MPDDVSIYTLQDFAPPHSYAPNMTYLSLMDIDACWPEQSSALNWAPYGSERCCGALHPAPDGPKVLPSNKRIDSTSSYGGGLTQIRRRSPRSILDLLLEEAGVPARRGRNGAGCLECVRGSVTIFSLGRSWILAMEKENVQNIAAWSTWSSLGLGWSNTQDGQLDRATCLSLYAHYSLIDGFLVQPLLCLVRHPGTRQISLGVGLRHFLVGCLLLFKTPPSPLQSRAVVDSLLAPNLLTKVQAAPISASTRPLLSRSSWGCLFTHHSLLPASSEWEIKSWQISALYTRS